MLLAGCASYSSPGGSASTLLGNGRTVIAEDQYIHSGFQLNRGATVDISVEVHSGPSIDVIVVDELNFQQYRSGNAFVHYSACGGIASQGFLRSCGLPAGQYYVLLDNTDAGATSPPFNGVNDGADTTWRITGR